MRAAAIHGALLLVALAGAYLTWTREEVPAEERATVLVWRGSPDDVTRVRYDRNGLSLVVERRKDNGSTYLWGTVRPGGTGPTAADSGAGSAAVEEFPVGERGDELLQRVAPLTALRDMKVLSDSARGAFGLAQPYARLSVVFTGAARELLIGETVYGTGHRYALDPSTGRGYVLSQELARSLEGGHSALRLTTLHGFQREDVGAVTVLGAAGERTMHRLVSDQPGTDSWAQADANEPDQTFGNFMDRVQQLAVLAYEPDTDPDTLQRRVRIEYRNDKGEPLGFLELFRGAADSSGGFEYYLRTERTRVVGRAYRSLAERVDDDVDQIL